MATIEQLQDLIKERKQSILLNDALTRLRSNPDFILVIEKNYFQNYACELVKLKGYSNHTPEFEQDLERCLMGIGKLNQYLESIPSEAESARNAINDAESAITELESE